MNPGGSPFTDASDAEADALLDLAGQIAHLRHELAQSRDYQVDAHDAIALEMRALKKQLEDNVTAAHEFASGLLIFPCIVLTLHLIYRFVF